MGKRTPKQLNRSPLAVRTCSAVVLAATALGAGGCHFEGGMGFSADHETFVSTAWRPTTLSLLDTRTGETLWSVDVPVGKQCVVNFSKGDGPNERFPDVMEWEVMNQGRSLGTRSNRQAVPDPGARRLDVTYRERPEMPGTTQPGPNWDSTDGTTASMTPAMDLPPEPEMSGRAMEGESGTGSPDSAPAPESAPESAPPAEAPPSEAPASDEPPVDLPG